MAEWRALGAHPPTAGQNLPHAAAAGAQKTNSSVRRHNGARSVRDPPCRPPAVRKARACASPRLRSHARGSQAQRRRPLFACTPLGPQRGGARPRRPAARRQPARRRQTGTRPSRTRLRDPPPDRIRRRPAASACWANRTATAFRVQSVVRFRSWAFAATITVLADMSTAPTAGVRRMPHAASTPAASGIATML